MNTEDYRKRLIIALGFAISLGGYIFTIYPAWQVPLGYVFLFLAIWVFLDMETGRPARIPEELANKYEYEAPLEMEAGERKIKIPTDYQEQESLTVPSYFIDTNQHMNNSKYVQVAMKYVPKDFKIGQLRVEYKKAAVEGDTLIPRVTVESECITVALVAEDGKAFAIVKFFAKM